MSKRRTRLEAELRAKIGALHDANAAAWSAFVSRGRCGCGAQPCATCTWTTIEAQDAVDRARHAIVGAAIALTTPSLGPDMRTWRLP
jgi:hypothetical protein